MHDERQTPSDTVDALSIEDRIDAVCDRFEQGWSTEDCDVVGCLSGCDPSLRDRLFVELLLVDWELRGRANESPNWNDYFVRYPDFAPQIEAAAFKACVGRTPHGADRRSAGGQRRIGRFELIERLGAGAAGEVWKAHDPRLHRIVAIKIPTAQALNDDAIDRFLREGRAAAQLDHPNVVPVFEVERDGDTAFIVSAYIEGDDLRAWLGHVHPSPRQAAELCRQLADALHHAHEKGVVHRDLKPGNVMIDDGGRAHVTDFGLAKWLEDGRDMTLEGQLLGTPAYMSPEQARGHACAADRRTDVYGLGVLLYEMLTGRCPFEGESAAITYQVIHEEPQRPRSVVPGIPRDLETICLKAMSKLPADRYPSAQEMEVDLRRFLRGDPILARRVGRLRRGWRWVRRRPAIAAAVVFALAAAGALAAVNRLVQEKRDLLGLQTVTLATQPTGAKVVFVPLDEATGEPIGERRIAASTRSPVELELAPGDYLVVAALDDGRFHEVFRRVPRGRSDVPGAFAQSHWSVVNKSIALHPIRIPSRDLIENMAWVPVVSGDEHATRKKSVANGGFYMDCLEFSVADCLRCTNGELPRNTQWQPVPESYALTATYDEAIALAEKSGKRLPTEAEYARAVELRVPESAAFAARASATGEEHLGPVGMPSQDRTATTPGIYGLCTNVAEWTCTSAGLAQSKRDEKIVLSISSTKYQIVRGGDETIIAGNGTSSLQHRDPSLRVAIARYSLHRGLGFRCVRSISPRFVND